MFLCLVVSNGSYVLEIVSNSHGYLLTNVEFKPSGIGCCLQVSELYSALHYVSFYLSREFIFILYLLTLGSSYYRHFFYSFLYFPNLSKICHCKIQIYYKRFLFLFYLSLPGICLCLFNICTKYMILIIKR